MNAYKNHHPYHHPYHHRRLHTTTFFFCLDRVDLDATALDLSNKNLGGSTGRWKQMGFSSYISFFGTGRGCFFNQEKIDASGVWQDVFQNIHTYRRKRLGRIFSQNMIETWICCTLDCAFGPRKCW